MIATAEAQVVRSRFEALGTYGELLVDGRPAALGTAVRILQAELAAVDAACSRFRDDSELMAVNAAAGRTVAVSDILAEAVGVALTAAAQTDGDVDPMLGRALVAAGYDGDFAALPADGPAPVPQPPPPGAWSAGARDPSAGTVRNVLLDHPAVSWAAVKGRKAPIVGTIVTASVVTSAPVTEAELTAWCADRLPDYAVPRRLRFLDEIPMKETLKSDV